MKVLSSVVLTLALGASCGVGFGWLWSWGNGLAERGLLGFVVAACFTNLVAALCGHLVVWLGARPLQGEISRRVGATVTLILIGTGFLAMLYVSSRVLRSPGTEIARAGAHLFTWGLALGFAQVFRDLRDGTWFGQEPGSA